MRRFAAIVSTAAGVACVAPAAENRAGEAPAAAAPAPAPAAVSPAQPAGPATFLYAGELTQGGWIRGQAPAGATSARLGEQALLLDSEGRVFAAFDRDAGPVATLTAILRDGRTIDAPLSIAPRAWQIEHIDADFRAGG